MNLMNAPAALPDEKAQLLEDVVERLRAVPNVAAVVLGGSHASGRTSG